MTAWPSLAWWPPLRPPGAGAEPDFLRACIQCGQCAHACPYGALHMRGGIGRARNTPEVDPYRAPCWLCMKCQPQCPTGALEAGIQPEQTRMGRAVILQERCHNFTGTIMCATCYDRCPLRGHAVRLEGGITPAMTEACVGCGVCAYVCPVQAVVIIPRGAAGPAPAGAGPDNG